MSLLTLPLEVLEILFLYLDVEDLLTVWKVVDFEGSDFFWTKLCKREGYKNISSEEYSWKTVFYLNINWTIQKFVKREYKFNKYVTDQPRIYSSRPSLRLRYRNKDLLHGENLVIQSSEDEISLWNIDKSPVLIRTLPAVYLGASRSKLFTFNALNNIGLNVYSCLNNIYYELPNLQDNHSQNVFSNPSLTSERFAVTDEYIAAVCRHSTNIKVLNIEKNEEFILSVLPELVLDISIALLGGVLYININNGSKYVLRRYNLDKSEWLDDVMLFQQSFPIAYLFDVSSDLLISWTNTPTFGLVPPIGVWKSNGEFLKSLSLEFIHSHVCQRHMNSYSILWLNVEGEYIIFSFDSTNIMIWYSKEPDMCKYMYTNKEFYVGHNVIASNLIALSYSCGFKVVDFTKATYLYEVLFDSSRNSPHSLYQDYFVNQYFYVHLSEECKPPEQDNTNYVDLEYCLPNIYPCNKSSCANCASGLIKNCILTIYDFRSQVD